MQVLILRNRVLNDDTLYVADSDKVFNGNYVAMLEYYTYLNEWNDTKHIKRFRSMESLRRFLDYNYTTDEVSVMYDLEV